MWEMLIMFFFRLNRLLDSFIMFSRKYYHVIGLGVFVENYLIAYLDIDTFSGL